MKIAIFGTGMVGQTLAVALAAQGHSVTIGTRDVVASLANTQPNSYGMPGFGAWQQQHKAFLVASFADAAAWGDLLINATNGAVILDILKEVPATHLDSKVMIDAANSLDFSQGMPPRVGIQDRAGASIGERLQAAHPRLRVVKALNTITARAMLNPAAVQGGHSTLFIAGNDAAAKATVTSLLQSYGWKDILDLGGISSAAATELIMPLWLRVWGTLGQTTVFNFKVVR
jgi:8-hydroxy-5-deazaflavin:NADPH oxidoreductase